MMQIKVQSEKQEKVIFKAFNNKMETVPYILNYTEDTENPPLQ